MPKSAGRLVPDLTWIEKFIVRYYPTQPRWLRNLVFLILVLLLVFGTIRLTIDFPVTGHLFLKTASTGRRIAKGYEIEYAGTSVGTNSRGYFVLLVNGLTLAELLLHRDLPVNVGKEDSFYTKKLHFVLLSGAFDDVVLDPNESSTPLGINRAAPTGPAALWNLVPEAKAQDQGQVDADRLFLRSLALGRSGANVQEVFVTLESGKAQSALLNTATGSASGPIPIRAGSVWDFGRDYYLSVPATAPAGWGATVRVKSRGGFFGKSLGGDVDERFHIRRHLPFGQPVHMSTRTGADVGVERFSPFDAVIFGKVMLENVMDSLTTALEVAGFRVLVSDSPLGPKSEANAVFGGIGVPFSSLQTVIRALDRCGLPLKDIEYRRRLKSGNPYQIQIGGSASFNKLPKLTKAELERVLRARNDREFWAAVNGLRRPRA